MSQNMKNCKEKGFHNRNKYCSECGLKLRKINVLIYPFCYLNKTGTLNWLPIKVASLEEGEAILYDIYSSIKKEDIQKTKLIVDFDLSDTREDTIHD